MGLKNAVILIGTITLGMGGCAGNQVVSPADRAAVKQTWRIDCCNPGLSESYKYMCKDALLEPDRTLRDQAENQYIFTWSDCAEGKEPWRKYE